MPQKKRGLGRGLESLLSNDFEPQAQQPDSQLREIALDEIRPGRYQPRRDMDADALQALADSIRTQGIVQPLVVRELDTGYEIIAGERRWRAARLAELTHVPAIVRQLDDAAAMAIALIENIQREDLNPLEEATALRRLIDECGLTHAACAQAVGRSRASVSNLLRLADLNDDVRDYLWRGELGMGHARALLGLTGAAQSEVAHKVVARGATVRQTESLVRDVLAGNASTPGSATRRDPALARLESDLTSRLQAGVRIQPDRRGGGRLVIRYRNAEELDTLVDRFE